MTLKKHILQFLALRAVGFQVLPFSFFFQLFSRLLMNITLAHIPLLWLFPDGGDYLLQGILARAKGYVSVSLFTSDPLSKTSAFPQDCLVHGSGIFGGGGRVGKSKLN